MRAADGPIAELKVRHCAMLPGSFGAVVLLDDRRHNGDCGRFAMTALDYVQGRAGIVYGSLTSRWEPRDRRLPDRSAGGRIVGSRVMLRLRSSPRYRPLFETLVLCQGVIVYRRDDEKPSLTCYCFSLRSVASSLPKKQSGGMSRRSCGCGIDGGSAAASSRVTTCGWCWSQSLMQRGQISVGVPTEVNVTAALAPHNATSQSRGARCQTWPCPSSQPLRSGPAFVETISGRGSMSTRLSAWSLGIMLSLTAAAAQRRREDR
jgi:hypothetical protein